MCSRAPLFGACTLRTVWRALFLSLSLSLRAWIHDDRSCGAVSIGVGASRQMGQLLRAYKAGASTVCEYSLLMSSVVVVSSMCGCVHGVYCVRVRVHRMVCARSEWCRAAAGVVEPLVLERLEGPAARLGDTRRVLRASPPRGSPGSSSSSPLEYIEKSCLLSRLRSARCRY